MIRLTRAEKDRVKAEYLADPSLSAQALADRYGVSRTQIQRALAGVSRPRGGQVKRKLSLTQMAEMRARGLTYYQIGRQADLTESGVYRALTNGKGN